MSDRARADTAGAIFASTSGKRAVPCLYIRSLELLHQPVPDVRVDLIVDQLTIASGRLGADAPRRFPLRETIPRMLLDRQLGRRNIVGGVDVVDEFRLCGFGVFPVAFDAVSLPFPTAHLVPDVEDNGP